MPALVPRYRHQIDNFGKGASFGAFLSLFRGLEVNVRGKDTVYQTVNNISFTSQNTVHGMQANE